MIKVLIVDDSTVSQKILKDILGSDPEIAVIGVVKNGLEAVRTVRLLKPDVITMDIHMKQGNGFEVILDIMATYPVPILVVSNSFEDSGRYKAFQAIEVGALAVLKKPTDVKSKDYLKEATDLIRYIKTMNGVKLIKRYDRIKKPDIYMDELISRKESNQRIDLIVIGASTGGPFVLQQIISHLPPRLRVPIVIVQHMSLGFLESFIMWLKETTQTPIKIVCDGQRLKAGHVYFPPEDHDIEIHKNHVVKLIPRQNADGLCPTVASLFKSVAQNFGSRSVGILLTGMGDDGAKELLLLKKSGAITIAQSEESSVVFGMPSEAIRLGGATYVLNPIDITHIICNINSKQDNA